MIYEVPSNPNHSMILRKHRLCECRRLHIQNNVLNLDLVKYSQVTRKVLHFYADPPGTSRSCFTWVLLASHNQRGTCSHELQTPNSSAQLWNPDVPHALIFSTLYHSLQPCLENVEVTLEQKQERVEASKDSYMAVAFNNPEQSLLLTHKVSDRSLLLMNDHSF